jgi:phosphatidylserine/phosphatidylglycerophosphate/cardiolipin synthase-like enzyme
LILSNFSAALQLVTLIAQSKKHLIIASPFVQADEALGKEPLDGALREALRRGVGVEIASDLSPEKLYQAE